ncbi:MAG: hypothetical protein ACFFBC_14140 [Promethearchaeota archaeon]
MISEDVIKIYQETIDQFEENFYPDISGAVLHLSDINKNEESDYIYNGDEEIPFNERHPEYQRIFKEEFLE